jgi:hypothetical protein
MTISKARQILGKDAESYSDEELQKLVEKFRKLALFCVAEIDKREDAGQLNFESPK